MKTFKRVVQSLLVIVPKYLSNTFDDIEPIYSAYQADKEQKHWALY